ncbi:MAG TPA: citrate/2-methylcitrate synthase, partial [Candidatus Nanoarchaeia archaeon]|nr:citrate/2-methylcitrate synthase [Candidatus Nanoarchaeia archaeon]
MKFTKETTAIFYNLKPLPIQQMLDFDFLCARNPSVSAIVHPGRKGFHKAFFGQQEILIPVYDSLPEATQKHPHSEVLINFASHRSAHLSSIEALKSDSLKCLVIVAEGIPERQTKELITLAKQQRKLIIGPSTVGGIAAGAFRIAGYAGGKIENIIRAKLFRPGSVGLVSKSVGMMNELFNIIARTTDGVKEGIAVGGDLFPGSTLLDHLLRFESNPEIKLLVALGELGGKQEYEIIKAKQEGKITKPLIMWTPGTCADIFPWEVQFGHAGAKAGSNEESAKTKNQALREAGIIVPESFEQLEEKIKETFQTLGLPNSNESTPKEVPLDYTEAMKEGKVRKATNITSTISSDLGEEPTYGSVPISQIAEENYSLGNLLSLLWFKKKLPSYFTQFLEKCILLTADHGPAVSGAHNAIVASRAGKDVISSLCSGLLTIGPRFGGAIDDACRYFKEAVDSNKAPALFVEEMKNKGIPIPGIGHRVKSIRNPDKRVELLKEFAKQHFPATKYLDYALQVEKITTKKAENLILNVDGGMAVLFLDALQSSQQFSSEEIKEIIDIGYMNGLFALSRSIGIIGHILDQKR